MKLIAIITIIFGVFLFVVAGCLYHTLPTCKDDADLTLHLSMMLCSSIGGVCFIAAGLADWNKSRKDEK